MASKLPLADTVGMALTTLKANRLRSLLTMLGIVSAVLGRGTGFGSGSVSGKVRIAMSASDCARLEPGDILVARDTSADYLDGIREAAAVITEQPGEDSHAAVITGTPRRLAITAA